MLASLAMRRHAALTEFSRATARRRRNFSPRPGVSSKPLAANRLRSALFLGAAYVQREDGRRELCAPYLLAQWPTDLDPFAHGAVIAREVLVKAEPSSSAATMQVLGYDVVSVIDWEIADKAADVAQRWVKIRVRSGEGYLPEEQIRSPIEHAACFVKSEGRWRMTGLAPGGG